jgi:hypothetical protein
MLHMLPMAFKYFSGVLQVFLFKRYELMLQVFHLYDAKIDLIYTCCNETHLPQSLERRRAITDGPTCVARSASACDVRAAQDPRRRAKHGKWSGAGGQAGAGIRLDVRTIACPKLESYRSHRELVLHLSFKIIDQAGYRRHIVQL